MAVVDERGRLFGRVNLIDGVVGVFVIGLIPLLYGAAALFWSPQPRLVSIEPAKIAIAPQMRVIIHGEHLKPYLRVSFGIYQGKDFLFKSTRDAEVNLNPMPPGAYDVILYDQAQERARLPQALTILPAPIPPTRVTLVGVVGNLDATRAKQVAVGTTITGVGTVRKVGEPMPARVRIAASQLLVDVPLDAGLMLPVEIETGCDVQSNLGVPYCHANGSPLQPTVLIYGELAGVKLPFQIDQVRGAEPIQQVAATIRFSGPPEVVNSIRPGDVDHGLYANPLSAGARVASVRPRGTAGGRGEVDATLILDVQRGPDGWLYTSAPLRAGAGFTLRTSRFDAAGTVLTVSPEWQPKP